MSEPGGNARKAGPASDESGTAPASVTVEIRRVEGWQPPFDTGTDSTRGGWVVTCSEHGDLEGGWAYMREQDAGGVATRHQRRHHA